MRVEDVAAELYGLPPEEFTATRNARAREAAAAGERPTATAIRALRRPTAGAHLVNLLVRERGDEVAELLDLGTRLRAAQGTLGAADLRALDASRRALTRAVTETAVALGRGAGRTVSTQVATAVEETLRAAMVDAAAGGALATGLLTDTFSSTGLDPVDLTRVLALPDAVGTSVPRATTSGPPMRSHPDAADVEAATAALERAEGHQRLAEDEAREARQRAVAAARRRTELDAEVEQARRVVARLEGRAEAARTAEEDARRAQVTATRTERAAIQATAAATRALRALTGER